MAFASVPKDSGTYTFYRNMRPQLARHGVDLRCVSIGRENAALWEDAYADDGCVLLAPRSVNLRKQAKAFVRWCEDENVDIVMGINSPAVLSAIPHLPARVRAMSRCANGFDHGYRITLSGGARLKGIVALSPKLATDLVSEYRADPDLITLIPNGTDPARFEMAAQRRRGNSELLKIGFLGRLEHNQKGVLHLPPIADRLYARGVPFRLSIAGKGVHEDELRARLSPHVIAGRARFLGPLGPSEVADFLAKTDIFVFTSHFEGMPNALLEAMMAGCVPVCFNIRGTTDFMIEDGRTGALVAQGDVDAFAEAIAKLADQRDRLAQMSRDGACAARERFSGAATARAYADLFRTVMIAGSDSAEPRPWSEFVPDPNFALGLGRYLPTGLKTAIKKLRLLPHVSSMGGEP